MTSAAPMSLTATPSASCASRARGTRAADPPEPVDRDRRHGESLRSCRVVNGREALGGRTARGDAGPAVIPRRDPASRYPPPRGDRRQPRTRDRREAPSAPASSRPDDRVLVAVSGGRDSAATAALLAAARDHGLALDLTLGHVDHGWRGPDEAAADLAVVERTRPPPRPAGRAAGPPHPVRRTEDAARRHRYSSLETLARPHRRERRSRPAITCATRPRPTSCAFAAGSGPAGLAGIPARRPIGIDGIHVVRPVLSVEPRRLAEYAASRGLPFGATTRPTPCSIAIAREFEPS